MSDDIAAIFETVARGIDADAGLLAARAVGRGRRLRAWRRVMLAVTGAASAVAVTVATVTGVTMVGGARAGERPSHRTAPAASGGHHGPHRATAAPRPPQAHGPGMTSRAMLAALRAMLPPGKITYVYPVPGFWGSRGGTEINFDDGHGAVDIILTVQAPPHPHFPRSMPASERRRYWDSQRLRCPNPPWTDEGRRPSGALPISCVMRTLPDGSVERDAVSYADAAGFYGYLIEERRSDGIDVRLQVGNGTLGGVPHLARAGWPYVDRALPPGSMALWRSVVESPAWHL